MRRINHSSRFIEMFGDTLKNTKDWEFRRLPEVTTIVLGSTPSSSYPDYWDGSVKWITPAELDDNSFILTDSERHITVDGVRNAGLKSFPAGTVIFSTRAPIGKTAIAGCEMNCNQGFKNFICSKKLNPIYLFYTLRSHKEELQKMGTGSTFLELSKKTIENISVSVPERSLQDEFEVVYRQADKSKFSDFKSRFIEMFGNLESKKRLGDVASYINGFAFKPSDWSTTGLPIIRIQNLTGTNEVFNYYDGDYPAQVEVNNGDILISWSATLGVYVWLEGKALLNQHIFKVSFDKGYINRGYFIYAVTQKLDEMSTKTHGTTMRHIVKSDFDNTIIPFPSIDQQDQFALIASQADKSKYLN